jgi:homopolymeric O-antigen transport system permease protein
MWRECVSIFNNRLLLIALVNKELIIRYKGSMLGFLWSLVTPLFLMGVYTIVFGKLFSKFDIPNYHIYLLTGLLPWTFFSVSLANSVTSFLSNSSLITKVYFPRSLIPVSIVLSQTVHLFLSLILLAVFMWAAGMDFSVRLLLLPVVILIHVIMTSGMAMMLSILFVSFRDIQHLLETVLLAWFFFSPIIYPISLLQSQPTYWAFLKLNPLIPLLELYHRILYHPTYEHLPLEVGTFALAAAIALFAFLLGLYVLKRNEATMVKAL